MSGKPQGVRMVSLNAATSLQTGAIIQFRQAEKVVHAQVTGSGAVTATVEFWGNVINSVTNAVLLGTINLSGTATDQDGFAMDAPWPFIFAKLTVISGTSAAVTASIGA